MTESERYYSRIVRLRTENERLREAFQTIADGYDGDGPHRARVQGTGYPDNVQAYARRILEAGEAEW